MNIFRAIICYHSSEPLGTLASGFYLIDVRHEGSVASYCNHELGLMIMNQSCCPAARENATLEQLPLAAL